MERDRARRILGVAANVKRREVRSAHARLRRHVESRAGGDGTAADRGSELGVLYEAASSLGVVAGGAAPRWLLVWAIAASACALVLALLLVALLTRSAVGGNSRAAPVGVATGPASLGRASLRVTSDVAGAMVELLALEEGDAGDRQGEASSWLAEPAAGGPADGEALAVDPGRYLARVSHPDCPTGWESEVELQPGQVPT